jgi:parallel beta-helix repeat protein
MFGIRCELSNHNTFVNNSFINDSIFIEGYYSSNYIHTIYNNTLNGKPYYFFYNEDGFTVPSDAGSVFLFRCSNVTISGLNIDSAETGIKLVECSKCTIQNSNISNIQWTGIVIDASNGILIQNNQIVSAQAYGIYLTTSYYDEIKNNIISGDTWIGIAFSQFCQYNNITGNLIDIESSQNILEHPSTGIWLRVYCYNNNILDNIIRDCQIGLWMSRSHLNNIKKNLFENCHIGSSPNKINAYKEFNMHRHNVNPAPLTARGAGIYLVDTGENDISFNTISNNDVGMISYRSWFDNIQFNNIEDSTTGFDFITLSSLGYYPFNYWGASITGAIFKSNKLFCFIPWSPIRISEAP